MRKHPINSYLLPFYFGSIEDSDRLMIEKELLTNPDILLDFFDLKREIEAAQLIPQKPSYKVWDRLKKNIPPQKSYFLKLSLGMGIALIILCMSLFFIKSKDKNILTKMPNEIIFDSNNELPASSNVL